MKKNRILIAIIIVLTSIATVYPQSLKSIFNKNDLGLLKSKVETTSSIYSPNSTFQPNNLKPNYKNNEKNLMFGFGLGFEIPISNMKDRYGLMLFGNISGHNKINNDIYIGFNIFTSPEFATLFPSNTATNETGLTSICADIRYKFFTDKRNTSAYFNFGIGIYLTKDKYESTDPVNNSRLSVSPGVNLGVGLFGNISDDIILDVNSSYNLYYNSHIMEYPKYSSSKLFNYVLISASLKFFM